MEGLIAWWVAGLAGSLWIWVDSKGEGSIPHLLGGSLLGPINLLLAYLLLHKFGWLAYWFDRK